MKIYQATFLISTFIFTACSSTPPANTAANSAQNQSAANANLTVSSAGSPMETMKALNEAAKKKDSAAMKNLVSKGTLALMEENAKEQQTTVDELLKSSENAPFEELPEMRNEKIEGDKATVEVKNKMSEDWVTLPFSREDGVWKIALDRYVEEIKQKMLDDMKKTSGDNFNKEKTADKKESSNTNKAAKN